MRITDIQGQVINYPAEYRAAVDSVKFLIDSMEAKGIDRSDMSVVIKKLFHEASFHATFLPKRIQE